MTVGSTATVQPMRYLINVLSKCRNENKKWTIGDRFAEKLSRELKTFAQKVLLSECKVFE